MKKKNVLILVVILSVFVASYAQTVSIYEGTGYVYNDFLEGFSDTDFIMLWDEEDKEYIFVTSDFIYNYYYVIEEAEIEILRKNLLKYQEWEQIAIENETEIEKELPESKIDVSHMWATDSSRYWGEGTLYFLFFSQNTERHQLVISSDNIESYENEYIDSKLDPIYLDSDMVEAFLNGISEESKEKAFEELKKEEENSNLFQ